MHQNTGISVRQITNYFANALAKNASTSFLNCMASGSFI
ncbi:MAG: hypothetical protein EAZ47_09870 [Bacteroidetes bacterium]|nr:MAG: hypothetical protein EAY72_03470 [Bacteroidota bacterium]TAF91529.1 MAG: hypothetical protein EAZ47_09870 [Bacteroidota bacterium]